MPKHLLASVCIGLCSSMLLSAEALSPEEINDYIIESESTNMNIGFTAGTLGMGVNISKPINDFISLRFNLNQGKYTTTDDSLYNGILTSDKVYDLDTKGLLVDLHLWQVRVTAGGYLNNNKIIYTSRPTGEQQFFLNAVTYDAGDIAQVQSTITFNKISPYVGVGWGNHSASEGWSLSLDVGLMYHGNPEVDIDITAKEGVANTLLDRLKSDVAVEKKIQEEDLSDYPFYPVVMIGFNYSF